MSTLTAEPRYPQEREAEVVLRDGATVHVRPVRSDDGPAIHAFLEAVSPESIAFRFFGAANLDWATSWSVDVDYLNRYGLVVESGSPRTMAGACMRSAAVRLLRLPLSPPASSPTRSRRSRPPTSLDRRSP